MLKRWKKCLGLGMTLFCSVAIAAEAPMSSEAKDADAIVKRAITAYMEANQIPGVAVELYVDGKPKSYYFGYANASKKTPVSKNTIFEIGSISKVMTSLLLAEEIDFSKMHLNQSVRKYLPELSSEFDAVTLQNLATHTAGLSFPIPDSVKTGDVSELELANSPSQQWYYSNLSIGLLGHAIEKRTYKDINALYQKQILTPLGMQPIGMVVPKKLQANYAQGYDKSGKPVGSLVVSSSFLAATGGVKASAGDMQKFLKAAIGLKGTPEKIFYPMRLTQTGFVKLPNRFQGLGWEIRPVTKDNISNLLRDTELSRNAIPVLEIPDKPVYNGDTLIDKTGASDGFRTYIAVLPNKKTGIVILANRHAVDGSIVEVGREILFKLTGLM